MTISTSIPTLNADELEHRLALPLATVLSSQRNIRKPVAALSKLGNRQQQFVLHWNEVIARTNAEMAFQFVHYVPAALDLMPLADIESWAKEAMDSYEHHGLFVGVRALEGVAIFATATRNAVATVNLDEVSGMLAIYLNGLAGRRLDVSRAETAYTDTETVFLPSQINFFDTHELNRLAFKAMAAYLWAQNHYGSFRLDAAGQSLAEQLASFRNRNNAVSLFAALESIRLHACVLRDLPGLFANWQKLQLAQELRAHPSHWGTHVARLQRHDATAETSLAILPMVLNDAVPQPFYYQGKIFADKVADVMAVRIDREKAALQSALLELVRETTAESEIKSKTNIDVDTNVLEKIDITISSSQATIGQFEFNISVAGTSLGIPPELAALMRSILQDMGAFPADYLTAAGDNSFDAPGIFSGISVSEDDIDNNVLTYPEWNYKRHQYRENWCQVKEHDVTPVDEPFVADTLKKYHGEIQHLRKAFEALLGQDRLLKRQPDGDDIDFDAVVAAMTDLNLGREMPANLFTRVHRRERDIAVMFMVDMSGSTKGWVNDAEREALVLLCQALEILGDRYAIYGFSGMTRNRCDLYRIKQFGEPYSTLVEQRITGIKAQDYTRMGVTIRHLSKLLNEVDARTKLLITLSDGKPDDFDGYRGEYGIEDTRKALIEAKQQGIHSFCITIDDEARDYLPHMYGAVNYTIINDVRKLPLKVAEVYRRLTV